MNKMRDKILLKVPLQYSGDFILERKQTNYHNIIVVGIGIFLVQLIFLLMNIFNPFSTDKVIMHHYYRFYYVFIFLNLLILLSLIIIRKLKGLDNKVMTCFLVCGLFIQQMWSMGIAIADLFQGENIVIYFMFMYFFAILFDLRIYEYILITLFTFIIFILLLSLYIPYLGDSQEVLLNGIQHLLFASILRFYIGELKRKNYLQKKELEFYSFYDSLSGLYNRRKWEDLYHNSYNRACEQALLFSVILIDIDYFKQYNDTYGHVAGDEIVRKTSNVLTSVFKKTSADVARYGGDEFVISITGLKESDIQDLIEKIRLSISEMNVENIKSTLGQKLSLSMGYNTEIPQDKSKSWAFVVKADEALYLAKSERGK